jgi:uncharacterized protein with HEPN domain
MAWLRQSNIIVHDYLGINSEIIVATVENDIPNLYRRIESILEEIPDI